MTASSLCRKPAVKVPLLSSTAATTRIMVETSTARKRENLRLREMPLSPGLFKLRHGVSSLFSSLWKSCFLFLLEFGDKIPPDLVGYGFIYILRSARRQPFQVRFPSPLGSFLKAVFILLLQLVNSFK